MPAGARWTPGFFTRPETEKERQVAQRVQPQAEQVVGEVGKAAKESAEHLRPAAQED